MCSILIFSEEEDTREKSDAEDTAEEGTPKGKSRRRIIEDSDDSDKSESESEKAESEKESEGQQKYMLWLFIVKIKCKEKTKIPNTVKTHTSNAC